MANDPTTRLIKAELLVLNQDMAFPLLHHVKIFTFVALDNDVFVGVGDFFCKTFDHLEQDIVFQFDEQDIAGNGFG